MAVSAPTSVFVASSGIPKKAYIKTTAPTTTKQTPPKNRSRLEIINKRCLIGHTWLVLMTDHYDPAILAEALAEMNPVPEIKRVFVMPDIERNGNSFVNSSILSIAVVAVDDDGHKLTEFYAKMEEREECVGDDDTHEWWLQFPEQYAEAILDPRPIEEVMRDFAVWVGSLSKRGKVVWCGGPTSADWPWLKFYVDMFSPYGFSLGHKCRCLSTLAKAFQAMHEASDDDIDSQVHAWCVDIEGEPHDPRYDAYCQARTFAKMAKAMNANL